MGIIKKAKEITVLCDAKVSLVIYSYSGKMHEYCSPSTNLVDMLDKYQTLSGTKLWDVKHEGQILEEENRHLQYIMQQSEMAAMEGNMGPEMEINGYRQAADHQRPFSFRIQPMQPNLHERI